MTNIFNNIYKRLNKTKITDLVLMVFILVVFTLVGWRFIDPDYGWRLRTGQHIISNGIPETDIYTYTMLSFPWVDHAWPQDVVIYLTYSYFGKFIQTLLWAIVALGSLLVASKIFKGVAKYKITIIGDKSGVFKTNSYLLNMFLILGFLSLINYFGVRVQVVTWLFFSVFIYLLFNRKLWLKVRNFLPVYFLIWAILHGGFASGLAAFALFWLVRSFRKREIDKQDLIIFILSFLITLINPYGPGIWREVWSSISDSQLRWRIQEWMPFIFTPNWSTAFLMGMSSLFIILYRKKYKLEELALFFVFLIQALMSTRHVPLWTLIAIPMGTKSMLYLYQEAVGYEHGKERFRFFYKILWSLVLFIFAARMIYTGLVLYRSDEQAFYPEKAVEFLKSQNYEGRMFSVYGWGGYLIWKYPEKQVYIDGRMPSWRWEADIPGETNSASDDYFSLLEGEGNLEEEINKYEIKTILWRSEKKEDFWELLSQKIRGVFLLKNKESFELTEELEELGWEKIYVDETAVIYRHP